MEAEAKHVKGAALCRSREAARAPHPQEYSPDVLTVLELRLGGIKTAMLLKSASSKPLEQLLGKTADIERVMCLRASLTESVLEVAAKMEKGNEWLPSLNIDPVLKKVEQLKAACVEARLAELHKAMDGLKPVALGGQNGVAWKKDVPADPTIAELHRHAKDLLRSDSARAITAKFKSLKQDLHAQTNLAKEDQNASKPSIYKHHFFQRMKVL